MTNIHLCNRYDDLTVFPLIRIHFAASIHISLLSDLLCDLGTLTHDGKCLQGLRRGHVRDRMTDATIRRHMDFAD